MKIYSWTKRNVLGFLNPEIEAKLCNQFGNKKMEVYLFTQEEMKFSESRKEIDKYFFLISFLAVYLSVDPTRTVCELIQNDDFILTEDRLNEILHDPQGHLNNLINQNISDESEKELIQTDLDSIRRTLVNTCVPGMK